MGSLHNLHGPSLNQPTQVFQLRAPVAESLGNKTWRFFGPSGEARRLFETFVKFYEAKKFSYCNGSIPTEVLGLIKIIEDS